MNLNHIGIVFKKEIKESFRDRTTLFVSYILPFIIYPIVTIILVQAAVMKVEKNSSEIYRISVFGEKKQIFNYHDKRFSIIQINDIAQKNPAKLIGKILRDKNLDAIIFFEKGYNQNINANIFFNSTIAKSGRAKELIEEKLKKQKEKLLVERLQTNNFDQKFLTPLISQSVDLSPPEKSIAAKGSFALIFITIYLLILGMYNPIAVSTIGEKDRGTLLVVLGTSVNLIDLILGKFLNVLVHGFLTIMSYMTVSIIIIKTISLGKVQILGTIANINSPISLVIGLILMSVLLASAAFFITGFAKNMSQSGALMTFLMLFGMVPAFLAKYFEVSNSLYVSTVPVLNIVLLLEKSLYQTIDNFYLTIVVLSTFFWSALLLFFYVRVFKKFQVYA